MYIRMSQKQKKLAKSKRILWRKVGLREEYMSKYPHEFLPEARDRGLLLREP